MTSAEVRGHLIKALRADLVGPFVEGQEEIWDLAPSKRYLSGFLVPHEQSQLQPDDEEEDDPADEESIRLDASLESESGIVVGDSGLRIYGHLDKADNIEGLPEGTRALSLFLVNARPPSEDKRLRVAKYVFQARLELRHERGLIPGRILPARRPRSGTTR